MATVLYRNAQLLLNGAELTGVLHELTVDYKAEMLDATTFGADTRIKKAGLFLGAISGKGFFDNANQAIESALFGKMPSGLSNSGVAGPLGANPAYESGAAIEDVLFLVFPDGVTEGSATTGTGYALKGVLESLTPVAGAVGVMLDVSFAAQSRGIAA